MSAPLAFLAPVVIEAIADGRALADLTARQLAKVLADGWAKQSRILGAR